MEFTIIGAIFIIVTSFVSSTFCLTAFRLHLESLTDESRRRFLNVLYYHISIHWQFVTVLASANVIIVVILEAPEESNIVKGKLWSITEISTSLSHTFHTSCNLVYVLVEGCLIQTETDLYTFSHDSNPTDWYDVWSFLSCCRQYWKGH